MMLKNRLHAELKSQQRTLAHLAVLTFFTALCLAGFAASFAKLFSSVFLHDMDLPKAAPLLGVLLSLVLLRHLLSTMIQRTAKRLSLQVQESLRCRLSAKLLSLPPLARGTSQTGDFIALSCSAVDEIDSYFSQFIPQLLAALILPLVLFAAALAADPLTALIFFITAPLIPFLLYLIGRLSAEASARQWRTLSSLSRSFFELLQGLPTLKIFNRSREQSALVNELSDEFRTSTLKVLRIAFLSAFVLELTATLSIAMIAVSIGLRLLNGSLDFSAAFFALLLAPEFYQPLRHCGSAFHQALTALTASSKIYDFLAAPAPPQKKSTHTEKTRSPFAIRFADVHYRYESQREAALQGLSLTIKAGTTAFIVGSSGAGKSTIFQLLLQFAQPSQGNIFINDLDLGRIAPDFWRSRVAYVPQQPHIFGGSLAENIALAKPDAGRDEIIRAAKAANLHAFIAALPQGYETPLSGGQALSGGQIQRIAIARAFLQDKPLLLLDEPTSALDENNEQELSAALANLSAGKTTLIATHKLAGIDKAAMIFVIGDGRVLEAGRCEDLLQRQGAYFELATAQGGIL